MITTDLTSAHRPLARPLLTAAARSGVRYFKTGIGATERRRTCRRRSRPLEPRSKIWRRCPRLWDRDGLPQPRRLHRRAHCGTSPRPWTALDAAGRATTSIRGTPWPRAAAARGKPPSRLVAPRLKMLAVKDCLWAKTAKGWQIDNCPLGDGLVDWASSPPRCARRGSPARSRCTSNTSCPKRHAAHAGGRRPRPRVHPARC